MQRNLSSSMTRQASMWTPELGTSGSSNSVGLKYRTDFQDKGSKALTCCCVKGLIHLTILYTMNSVLSR